MGQEEKVLQVLYENPSKKLTVREIAKISGLPRATVHKKLVELRKSKIINEDNSPSGNLLFKIKKINFFVEQIIFSGLIDEIIEKLNPVCIILFGSIRKGESDKGSDIDLFVQSSIEKNIDVSKYEKKLGHGVELLIKSNLRNVNENLRNNIVNGIKLQGYLDIKW